MISLCTALPCQDFSFSGNQEGGDVGSGTRSSLMYETIRIVNNLQPKYVVWENVANVTKEPHKVNFYKYLTTMEKIGYKNYWKILNAKDYEIPQQRNRIFVLSIKNDIDNMQFEFPIKRKLKKSFKDYLQEDYDIKRIVLNEKELALIREYNNKEKKDTRPGELLKENETIYPTILAKLGNVSGRGGVFKCKEGYRKITPLEAWRLMGFKDEDYYKAEEANTDEKLYRGKQKQDIIKARNKKLYHQAGNSIVVNVLEAILMNLFYRTYKQNEVLDNIIKALTIVKNDKVYKSKNIARRALFIDNIGTYFVLELSNFKELTDNISCKYIKEDGTVNYNCAKLLEAVNIELSNSCFSEQVVNISKDKLLKFFERQSKNDLIKELKKYLQILKNTKICFYHIPKGSTTGKYIEMKLCDDTTAFTKRELHFVLSSEIYEFLKNSGTYIYMPSNVLKSYNSNLAYKTIMANKDTVISVKKIYDILDIREYKKDDEKREAHFEKIRRKFDEALNSIPYLNWKYDRETNGRYKKWIEANIIIKWNINPLIEAKALNEEIYE